MAYIHQHQGRFVSFQSPRKWGGVGLLITASSPATAGPLFRFNPLGGGAGSRVRVHAARDVDPEFRFNPLGGGAGSGSQSSSWPLTAFATVSFQSPRRWGGVGRLSPKRSSKACSFRFNPLGGGAGSGSHQRLVSIFVRLLPILAPRFPLRAARSRGRVALASKSPLWLQGAARWAASCRRGQPIEHDLPEWAPEF